MTTLWSQTSGPGTVTFGNSAAFFRLRQPLVQTGFYVLTFQAIKATMVTSVQLTVVVGNVAYGPTLKLRLPFDDAGPGTTTPSDTSLGSEVNVTLQMLNSSGGVRISTVPQIPAWRDIQPQPRARSLHEPQRGKFWWGQRKFCCRHQFRSRLRKRQQLRRDDVDEAGVSFCRQTTAGACSFLATARTQTPGWPTASR